MAKRTVLKIAGESGMGIDSTGAIVMKTLKKMGFFIHSEREFPSVIKGGRANYQINFAIQPLSSLSTTIDLSLALDREGLLDSIQTLKPGGILINGFERWNKVVKELPKVAEEKDLKVFTIPARDIAEENGGSVLMVNVVLLGFLWKTLGFDIQNLQDEIAKQFAKKPALVGINLECALAGYQYQTELHIPQLSIPVPRKVENTLLIDGNSALGLGAIRAGVRTYFGYPMSPSSTILGYIAKTCHTTGIVVKQAEDEITAAQMTLGSMHMGTRSLTATSGGGFDLMSETISLSGMIETPLVVVIAQRPGPATGLPTWTGQADLDLAIYSGHGEYAKCVIACSDPSDCFDLIQKAFNIAEKYQIPVIILTEATIAMSVTTVPEFVPDSINIERHLTIESSTPSLDPTNLVVEKLEPKDRYQITENGISQRWIPGSSQSTYFANGDEHSEDGSVTEEAEKSKEMIAKRIRKLETLKQDLPPAQMHGPKTADISFVGWGSSKNTILDAINILQEDGTTINYLHFEYLWPLKTDILQQFAAENQNLHLIEGNYHGQLGRLLEKEGYSFKGKLLKWDGRPFYVEDVVEYARKNKISQTKVQL